MRIVLVRHSRKSAAAAGMARLLLMLNYTREAWDEFVTNMWRKYCSRG